MEHAQRDKELSDLPNIRFQEGRHILGIGEQAWSRLWEQVYKYEVKHWPEASGVKINTASLVKAIYPDIKKNEPAVAMLVQDFTWRLYQERSRRRQQTRDRRLRKKNGET